MSKELLNSQEIERNMVSVSELGRKIYRSKWVILGEGYVLDPKDYAEDTCVLTSSDKFEKTSYSLKFKVFDGKANDGSDLIGTLYIPVPAWMVETTGAVTGTRYKVKSIVVNKLKNQEDGSTIFMASI